MERNGYNYVNLQQPRNALQRETAMKIEKGRP